MVRLAKTPQPRSAYHLYFRFYRNSLHLTNGVLPSFGNVSIDKQRELCKRYVERILYTNPDESDDMTGGNNPKFFGSESFAGMSKRVSKQWRESDEFTHSVFKELAKEDRDRYNKALFRSYQTSRKNYSMDNDIQSSSSREFNPFPMNAEVVHYEKRDEQDTLKSKALLRHGTSDSQFHNFKEVDISDEELIYMATTAWDICLPKLEMKVNAGLSLIDKVHVSDDELTDFLSGIDWSQHSSEYGTAV